MRKNASQKDSLVRINDFVEQLREAPHEIYYLELSLKDRLELARDARQFLQRHGVPVRRKQRVVLQNYYELARQSAPNYVFVISTNENLVAT